MSSPKSGSRSVSPVPAKEGFGTEEVTQLYVQLEEAMHNGESIRAVKLLSEIKVYVIFQERLLVQMIRENLWRKKSKQQPSSEPCSPALPSSDTCLTAGHAMLMRNDYLGSL
jgi:hypothetical protein